MRVKINARPNYSNLCDPSVESHWGFVCDIVNGELFADVPEELLQGEIGAGHVSLIEP